MNGMPSKMRTAWQDFREDMTLLLFEYTLCASSGTIVSLRGPMPSERTAWRNWSTWGSTQGLGRVSSEGERRGHGDRTVVPKAGTARGLRAKHRKHVVINRC